MVDTIDHCQPSMRVLGGSSFEDGMTTGALRTSICQQSLPASNNYSYPLCVSEALQALESLTLEEAARDEGLYWEELEELNGTTYELNQNSLPLGSHVQKPSIREVGSKKDGAFDTPSRTQLETWIAPTVQSDTAQSQTGSRTKERRSSLFHTFTAEELLVALSSTDEPSTDQEAQSSVGSKGRHHRNRHQKSASHEGLRHRPAARAELRHRAVKSLDTGTDQLRSSHGDSGPQSPSRTPPRLRLYPVVKEQPPLILTRQERSGTLPRVDENEPLGSIDSVSTNSMKRPWTSNGTQPTVGGDCDTFAYNNDKRRDSWAGGSIRRKEKDGKGGWLHKMTDWLTVTEPSAQALKQHRKEVFRRAGISPEDPEACSKLHVPIGEIPSHAVKPSGPGPEPEEVLKRELEEKRSTRSSRETSRSGSRISHSSSYRSKHSKRPVARSRVPDEIFPFN
ncbi:hypothetical protein DL546_006123 [Coniochaeta pulveracea]|uniref:Uncharacterized protein n=1 Tax=Coniochaeta pulveracea TaxID=177199 RepID=A0A420Y4H2_9PEZI|nr:hypothetical protein DL546_006123 [Coniochaeta pulveracea]